MRRQLQFIFLLLALSSCANMALPCFCGCCGSKHISVLNEPIDQNRLASVHVNAPDPRHEENAHGQRLYVSWGLPHKYKGTELTGILKVRYHSPEQAIIPFVIDKLRDTFIYEIVDEEYFKKEGILAYQIQIFSDGELVDTYQHSMWTELITKE